MLLVAVSKKRIKERLFFLLLWTSYFILIFPRKTPHVFSK